LEECCEVSIMNEEKLLQYFNLGKEAFSNVIFSKRERTFIGEKANEIFFMGVGAFASNFSFEQVLIFLFVYLVIEFMIRDRGLAENQIENLNKAIDETDF